MFTEVAQSLPNILLPPPASAQSRLMSGYTAEQHNALYQRQSMFLSIAQLQNLLSETLTQSDFHLLSQTQPDQQPNETHAVWAHSSLCCRIKLKTREQVESNGKKTFRLNFVVDTVVKELSAEAYKVFKNHFLDSTPTVNAPYLRNKTMNPESDYKIENHSKYRIADTDGLEFYPIQMVSAGQQNFGYLRTATEELIEMLAILERTCSVCANHTVIAPPQGQTWEPKDLAAFWEQEPLLRWEVSDVFEQHAIETRTAKQRKLWNLLKPYFHKEQTDVEVNNARFQHWVEQVESVFNHAGTERLPPQSLNLDGLNLSVLHVIATSAGKTLDDETWAVLKTAMASADSTQIQKWFSASQPHQIHLPTELLSRINDPGQLNELKTLVEEKGMDFGHVCWQHNKKTWTGIMIENWPYRFSGQQAFDLLRELFTDLDNMPDSGIHLTGEPRETPMTKKIHRFPTITMKQTFCNPLNDDQMLPYCSGVEAAYEIKSCTNAEDWKKLYEEIQEELTYYKGEQYTAMENYMAQLLSAIENWKMEKKLLQDVRPVIQAVVSPPVMIPKKFNNRF